MITEAQICEYLKDIPSKWREQLTSVLISIQQEVDCEQVKECETLTSLSNFTIDGTEVSIQYKDEDGVTVTRSFDTESILNTTLEDVDPSCLATPTEWSNMTYTEKIQLIITSHCDCCEPTSTTTTTTTP